MSEEKAKLPTFSVDYDDMSAPTRVTISVELSDLAKNREAGTMMLRGFMEEKKHEILRVIMHLRVKEDSKLIKVAGAPAAKVPLEIH